VLGATRTEIAGTRLQGEGTAEESLHVDGYGTDGWTGQKEVDPGDAEWFMAAIRSGLVEQLPKVELWLPESRYRTTIWEDLKTVVPRPFHFFMEGSRELLAEPIPNEIQYLITDELSGSIAIPNVHIPCVNEDGT
jgi:hypothetical protein